MEVSQEQPASNERTALRELVFYFAQEIERLKSAASSGDFGNRADNSYDIFIREPQQLFRSARADPNDAGPWQVRAVEDTLKAIGASPSICCSSSR